MDPSVQAHCEGGKLCKLHLAAFFNTPSQGPCGVFQMKAEGRSEQRVQGRGREDPQYRREDACVASLPPGLATPVQISAGSSAVPTGRKK